MRSIYKEAWIAGLLIYRHIPEVTIASTPRLTHIT
jgi:hypothetical protein